MIVIVDVFMQITNILLEEGGLDLITGDAGYVTMGGLPKMGRLFLKGEGGLTLLRPLLDIWEIIENLSFRNTKMVFSASFRRRYLMTRK